MSSRNLNDLTPTLKEKVLLLHEKAEKAGLSFIITCTARDTLEHLALYAQGRMPLQFVNMLRAYAGMAPIDEKANERKVTWTLNSRHVVNLLKGEKAQAFDVALKDKSGRVHWDIKIDVQDDEIPDYEQLGLLGESIGLKWGGRFKNRADEPRPDRPHFQEI